MKMTLMVYTVYYHAAQKVEDSAHRVAVYMWTHVFLFIVHVPTIFFSNQIYTTLFTDYFLMRNATSPGLNAIDKRLHSLLIIIIINNYCKMKCSSMEFYLLLNLVMFAPFS